MSLHENTLPEYQHAPPSSRYIVDQRITLHGSVDLVFRWNNVSVWVNSKAEKQAKKRKKHGKIRWQFTLMSGEKSIRSTKCLAMFSMLHTNRSRCVLNTPFLNCMTSTGVWEGHSALIALKNYLVNNQRLDPQGRISNLMLVR